MKKTRALLAVAILAAAACKDDPQDPAGPFAAFDPAANDPARFTEPRDAVPLDNGGIAFIARAPGTAGRDAENAGENGMPAALADRYAVFVIDAPGGAARIVHEGLVAPFNIAAHGDHVYVADLGGGADASGAVLDIALGGGQATLLGEGFRPQGVTTDASGKVHMTGRDPATGLPGVFALDGNNPRAIVTGGDLRSPSGLDIADDGTLYVADSTAGGDLPDELAIGSGRAAVFEIKGGNARAIASGIEGGYPTGIAISKDGKLIVSAYVDRGSHSAVLILDPAKPK